MNRQKGAKGSAMGNDHKSQQMFDFKVEIQNQTQRSSVKTAVVLLTVLMIDEKNVTMYNAYGNS